MLIIIKEKHKVTQPLIVEDRYTLIIVINVCR